MTPAATAGWARAALRILARRGALLRAPSGPQPPASRGTLRRPAARVAMAVVGAALLGVAVASTITASRAAALDDLDHALAAGATSNAGALQEYFERAQSIALLLANDSAFRQFEPGGLPDSGPEVDFASAEAGAAMAYLEQLYPGRISEACLIDSTGTETARVVHGVVAPDEELSTEEASATFFAPTMRLPRGHVHQAAPYLSPDTGEWVISNSTPMVSASGEPWGLVHFEVALDSFRPAATSEGFSTWIVDTRSGLILLDSGQPSAAHDRLDHSHGDHAHDHGAPSDTTVGRPAPPELSALVARDEAASAATLDGRRVAVAHVAAEPDNANSWAVVVSAPAGAVSWHRSIGAAPVAMAVASLMLLAFAGLNSRASHRQLRAASLSDDLTGLPNRRLLTDRLDQALLLARRRGVRCAVLLIDLDRFKEVNDTLGHHHGDELLRAVAHRLQEVFRESDTVARLGGDEFAVLLHDVTDEAAAAALAHRCLGRLQEAFTVDGIALSVEASIGLAMGLDHGSDGNALMRAADVAMYEAKRGKSGVSVYEPGLDVHTPTRLALLGELRRGLAHDELFLHFQPKVSLSTQELRGVEALVRWQHPDRGLVPPGEFVPVAEGTGLILPLTLRTLDLAIAQCKEWSERGHEVQVAVNLSPRCLSNLDFPALVAERLEQHGLPARLLRLEITESTIMADPPRSLAVLTALQQQGIALSIDDFGTGYSSMTYLKRLPVDELKVDRSFVLDMLVDRSDAVLVRSSIDLGHNLGLSVVAEGVEDAETLAALTALGCDVAQGYHLARPMPAVAVTQWLDSRTGSPAGISAGAV